MRCDEVAFIMDDVSRFAESYPTCLTDANYGYVAVQASFKSGSSPEKIGAAFRLTFGMGMWVAILVHVIGVEIYVGPPCLISFVGSCYDTNIAKDSIDTC